MKIPKMLWVVAAMLFLATAINYTDRNALSIVSPALRREFGMSEQDYSYVITAFLFAYAVMYAGSGYIVDRLGTKRGFALFISVWSVAAILHGLTVGKWSLAAARFLLGLGEPGNWPAAAKAVQEWFPPSKRALGVGIFNAGSSLGSAAAPPVVAALALTFGWRSAFYFTGALGVLWLIAWLILYDAPAKNRWLRPSEYQAMCALLPPVSETTPASPRQIKAWQVMRSRPCLTLMLARFFTDPVLYFAIFWLPEYLHKERGFDTKMIGQYAWVPFIFGGIAYVFGGYLSGRLIHAGWSLPRARKGVMTMGAALMPVAILAPLAPNAALAIAAVCFLTAGHGLWTSNLQALPTDLFPGHEVGTATGFSGMGGSVGGMLANLGTGYIVAHFTYSPVFLVAGLMHPLSVTLVWRLLPDRQFIVRL